jgi:hypothetical protein
MRVLLMEKQRKKYNNFHILTKNNKWNYEYNTQLFCTKIIKNFIYLGLDV